MQIWRTAAGMLLCSAAVFGTSGAAIASDRSEQSAKIAPDKRPNILVILADDMGWSDIGAFGGEISTPNLDTLAKRGVRLTNFHASPFCSPTRAMLLTGSDNHEVGLGNMAELATPEQRGRPGYEGYLNNRAVTIAQRLHDSGYRTLMAGKWHLGIGEQQSPASWGYDRSFAMLRGEANHYKDSRTEPSPDGADVYRLDGKIVGLPNNFYSSDYFADTLNAFVNEQQPGKPFYGYLAFTAPHSPLQAPKAVIAHYRGKYDAGPQALADARLLRQKKLGLVDASAAAHPIVGLRDWRSLSAEQRALSTRRMEIYAAMIEEMDSAIGRVIANLKRRGELDNTIIMFMSDNGAAGASREENPKWGPWITRTSDNSLANMGAGNSYVSTGPSWAQASMAPSGYFKGFTSEGGTHSPAILAGPSLPKARTSGGFASVTDIVPTMLAIAGVAATDLQGKAPLRGQSLLTMAAKPASARTGPTTPAAMEMRGGRAVRQGDWKAVVLPSAPSGLPATALPLGRWLLFNVARDPGETTDVAAQHPDILKRLTAAYDNYAVEVGAVALPGVLKGDR